MKLDVVTKTDGNIVIRSTWIDNPKAAVKAYHHFLDILSGDPDTQIGWVAILDDELKIFENYRERVSNVVPTPATYTVDFNSHGGSSIESQMVTDGELVIKPTDPEREGYDFIGWELNGYEYDFDSPVTKDIVLVATWEKSEEPQVEEPSELSEPEEPNNDEENIE